LLSISLGSVAEEGSIRDVTTGQPIAGAYILLTWEGTVLQPAHPGSTCYKAEVVTSDESGRFLASTFSWTFTPLLFDRTRMARAFVPGYEEALSSDSPNLKFLMKPIDPLAKDRFDAIYQTVPPLGGCGEDQRIYLPLAKAEYAALQPLAHDRDQNTVLEYLLHRVETLELGQRAADRKQQERLQKVQQRASISSGCAGSSQVDFVCCVALGSPDGFPALVQKIKESGLQYREGATKVCVRLPDLKNAEAIALQVAASLQ
jgi:hypothetical protein